MDGQYGFNNQVNTSTNAPNYKLWLILGIIQTCLFCCCCSVITCIFGIATIILAVTANNYFKQGNMVLYRARMKAAMIVNIIGWVVTFLGFIIGLATGLIESFATALSNY